jgi:hypothetical protein
MPEYNPQVWEQEGPFLLHESGVAERELDREFPVGDTFITAPTQEAPESQRSETDGFRAGSPRGITRPGLPQIRTCPLGHTARHVMISLRDGTRIGSLPVVGADTAPAVGRIDPREWSPDGDAARAISSRCRSQTIGRAKGQPMRKCPPPPLGTILAESIAIAVGSDPRLFVLRLDPKQCEAKALGNMIAIWRPLPVSVALPCPFHSGVANARLGPRACPRRGLTTMVISGRNHTAFDLAVYASRGRSPVTTQDSLPGCWPGSAGRDCLPAGSL